MASFAANQVARLELLLQQNVGLQQITIGGQTIQYDDLLKQYDYWKSRQGRENGTRPIVSQIRLDNYR